MQTSGYSSPSTLNFSERFTSTKRKHFQPVAHWDQVILPKKIYSGRIQYQLIFISSGFEAVFHVTSSMHTMKFFLYCAKKIDVIEHIFNTMKIILIFEFILKCYFKRKTDVFQNYSYLDSQKNKPEKSFVVLIINNRKKMPKNQ